MSCSDGYVLVGNFGLDFDALKGKFLDASTDLKFRDFFKKIQSLSKILDIQLVDFFDGVAVLKASPADYEYLKKYIGEQFCLTYTDEDGFSQARDMETCESTGQPGITAFKGRASESHICLRPKGCRYDA